MATPGKPNVDKSELLFDEFLANPEIAREYLQAFAKMLGWDDGNEIFRFLAVDSDGRIETSALTLAGDTGNASAVTVTTTSGTLLASNPDRKNFRLLNNGSNDIALNYGTPAVAASGYLLPVGGSYYEERYTGIVTAIAISGSQDIRVLEVS